MHEKEPILSHAQLEVVNAPQGRHVFLGGPGAGKSPVLAEWAKRLIAGGIAKPDEGRDGDFAPLRLSDENLGGRSEATAKREAHGRWTVLRAEIDGQLEGLGAELSSAVHAEKIDVSCSGLMLYSACPRHYRYIYVDRLPSRPSPAAAIGREAHRRLEELGRPAAVSPRRPGRQETPDEDYARVAEEQLEDIREHRDAADPRSTRAPQGGRSRGPLSGERVRATSVHARRGAVSVAAPGGSLAGRIDRLDELPGGDWDLVDFKSGTPAFEAAEVYRRQLALYTLAVRDMPAVRISAYLFFLQDGSDLALSFTNVDLADLKKEVDAALLAIGRDEFPARLNHPSAAAVTTAIFVQQRRRRR